MIFPYHFVTIDGAQELRRRQLLDGYGQFAQLSILLVPLIYQLLYGLGLLIGRLRSQHRYQLVKEHQSPVVSRFEPPEKTVPSNIWARLRWALDDEIVEGWGTRQEWLIAALWAAWLLLLIVKDTGDGT